MSAGAQQWTDAGDACAGAYRLLCGWYQLEGPRTCSTTARSLILVAPMPVIWSFALRSELLLLLLLLFMHLCRQSTRPPAAAPKQQPPAAAPKAAPKAAAREAEPEEPVNPLAALFGGS